MQSGSGTLKVLGFLGRALSLELSAVQMYSTHARLLSGWGLDQAAAKLRHEALEEMQHAERIIARLLAHGAAPNASQLRPVPMGNSLPELLRIEQRFEEELVGLYSEAVRSADQSGNADDRIFFHELLEEERHHADELGKWIESLAVTSGSSRAVARSGYRRRA